MARVAGGNLAYARELATSESARRQRDLLLDLARDLPSAGLMDTAGGPRRGHGHRREPGRSEGARDRTPSWSGRWSGPATPVRKWLKKRHDEKLKRQQRRLLTQGLQTVTRVFAGWYRDLALVAAGREDAVLNQDRLEELRAAALPGTLSCLHPGRGGRGKAQERLRYNVDARCAIGDMFRSIKEALTQWPKS